MVSRKLRSLQYNVGFWGWLLTFSILNNIHKITATAANSAVDITATALLRLTVTRSRTLSRLSQRSQPHPTPPTYTWPFTSPYFYDSLLKLLTAFDNSNALKKNILFQGMGMR
jgi:hypothetical protein